MVAVPYLTYDYMEAVAQKLLFEYEQERGQLTPPILIDDIIENHLKLSLEIENLKDELETVQIFWVEFTSRNVES